MERLLPGRAAPSETIDFMLDLNRFSGELPVVDGQGRPVALMDIAEVVGLLPEPLPEVAGSGLKAGCRIFCEPQPQKPA
jgi:hypothetical protein